MINTTINRSGSSDLMEDVFIKGPNIVGYFKAV